MKSEERVELKGRTRVDKRAVMSKEYASRKAGRMLFVVFVVVCM